MSATIILKPDEITQLQPHLYSDFYLIVSPDIAQEIHLQSSAYKNATQLVIPPTEDLAKFITSQTPEESDILLLIPNGYSQGYKNPHMCLPRGILGKRRMVAMRCQSTPATKSDLKAMLESLCNIDTLSQIKLVDDLYAVGEKAQYLEIRDTKKKTHARFNHLSDEYAWHTLYGSPNPGEFVLAPAGETNVIVIPMAEQAEQQISLDINGEIILHGISIVHYGVKLNLLAKQAEVFNALDTLRSGFVIASVVAGKIVAVEALDTIAKPAAAMLEELFAEDERYRCIMELGVGLNEKLITCPGNVAANEFYGGQGGCLHYGIGRVPFTTFHIDIVCPSSTLQTDSGEHIFGPRVSVGSEKVATI